MHLSDSEAPGQKIQNVKSTVGVDISCSSSSTENATPMMCAEFWNLGSHGDSSFMLFVAKQTFRSCPHFANHKLFTSNEFGDVSILSFGDPPWQGDENTYLEAVAFRPGFCEGLIVGRHGASNDSFSPIAHFTDIRGPDCLPSVEDGGTLKDGFDGDGADKIRDAGTADDTYDDGADGRADDDHQDHRHDGQTQIPCDSDEQCPYGSYCDREFCKTDCHVDTECPIGHVCTDRGRCVDESRKISDCSCVCISSLSSFFFSTILILFTLLFLRLFMKL